MCQDIVTLLNETQRKLMDIESKADDALCQQSDTTTYRQLMVAKAELLAALADKASPYLATLTNHDLAKDLTTRLGNFSYNAEKALEIGSVFYMSALLYPDDHKKGEPNNLQRLVNELT